MQLIKSQLVYNSINLNSTTSSATDLLKVNGTANTGIALQSGNITKGYFFYSGTLLGVGPGSTTNSIIFYNNNIGIGTPAPLYNLDVQGATGAITAARISGASSAALLIVNGTGTGTPKSGMQIASNNTPKGSFWYDDHVDALLIGPGNLLNSICFQNGFVGIGTNPRSNYMLDVAGRIRANEVVINTTGADFVFNNNYKLRSLGEVESYIKENKRLPDIAPATEMQTNGVGVSELQTKLLQKLEETTLYLIELKKENEKLKERIEKLETK